MAAVSNKDIPDEFNMFGEIWTLYKKYYYPENTDEYWNGVRDDFNNLNNKYKTPLSRSLCHVMLCEFERKMKENNRRDDIAQ